MGTLKDYEHLRQPAVYSRVEAADVLRISLRTFDKFLASGQIVPRRIGKRVLIPRDEIERFIRDNSSGPVVR